MKRKTGFDGNSIFVGRLEQYEDRKEHPEIWRDEVRTFRTFTLQLPDDSEWRPRGARARVPDSGPAMTFPIACRLALMENLERMHRKPKGVGVWTIVTGCSSQWHTLRIKLFEGVSNPEGKPLRWQPISPFDLPPQIEEHRMTPADFNDWIMETNIRQFADERRWTIYVSDIKRTFRDVDSSAATWLQETDEALFQTEAVEPADWLKTKAAETVEQACQCNSAPAEKSAQADEKRRFESTLSEDLPAVQANGHTSPHRRYRLGLMDERGTITPWGDAMPQAEALELLERAEHGGAVLLPAGEGAAV